MTNPNDKTAYDYDCKLGDKRLADRIASLEATTKHMAKQGTPVGYLDTIEMLVNRIRDLEKRMSSNDAFVSSRIGRHELRFQTIEATIGNIAAVCDRSVDRLDVLYADGKKKADTIKFDHDRIDAIYDYVRRTDERFEAIEANIEGFGERIGELEDRHEDEDKAAASLVDDNGELAEAYSKNNNNIPETSPKDVNLALWKLICSGDHRRIYTEVKTMLDASDALEDSLYAQLHEQHAKINDLREDLKNRDERHAGIRQYRDKQDARIIQLENALFVQNEQIEELKKQRDAG